MIAIVDYGLGNLGSIRNMLKKIGSEGVITSDPQIISSAGKLILPGVGAFDNGMENLDRMKMTDLLNQRVLIDKVPVLGICLGMQLMTTGSEEGRLPGLGWVDAQTVKFRVKIDSGRRLPIPHMGWEEVTPVRMSKLLSGMEENPRFYFVHSYYVRCNDHKDVLFTSSYVNEFVSGFERENIVGLQFHPEKSHKYGMVILKNFAEHF